MILIPPIIHLMTEFHRTLSGGRKCQYGNLHRHAYWKDPDNNLTLTYQLENPWTPWKVSHLTGDEDSGVSSTYNYTCAVNVYGSSDKLVNGVTFKANTGTSGPGWQIISGFHKGHEGQNSTVNGGIGQVLDNRMRYDGNPQKILLTGLTPGKPYVFAFYNQAWDSSNKSSKLSCSAISEC